jgi:hypothetical protein
MANMGFQQAGIAIEKPEEFERLRAAIEKAIAGPAAQRFLQQLRRGGVRVRQFERVLEQRVLEKLGAADGAQQLYQQLPVSDQAQIREFYLTQIEQIAPDLRQKFHTQFETF